MSAIGWVRPRTTARTPMFMYKANWLIWRRSMRSEKSANKSRQSGRRIFRRHLSIRRQVIDDLRDRFGKHHPHLVRIDSKSGRPALYFLRRKDLAYLVARHR